MKSVLNVEHWHKVCFNTIVKKTNKKMDNKKDIDIEELLKKAEAEQNNKDNSQDSNAKEEEKTEDNSNPKNETDADNATESQCDTEKTAEKTDPLAEAQAQIEQLKNEMLYKQAEFDNYRKRTIKEKADLILSGGEKTIKEILPVLDDFERALADKTEDAEAVREGMRLIFTKFCSILEKMGVKKIETEGADFNVDYHDAIALVPGMGDAMKGKVIDCTKAGYTLNDKVIRHAQVAVGQ